jgi:ankyrin repeat protein
MKIFDALRAIEKEDIDSFIRIVRSDPEILNVITEDGKALLLHAVIHKRLKIVNYLLRHHPHVMDLELIKGWRDKQGEIALMKAIKDGSCEIVDSILSTRRIDIAEKHKDIDILFNYLLKGFVRKILPPRYSPLNYACLHKNINMASLLLDHGAEPTEEWDNLLLDSAQEGMVKTVIDLLDKKKVNIHDFYYKGNATLLSEAILSDNPDFIKALIKRGADPLFINSKGENLLMTAVRYKKFNSFNKLLRLNAINLTHKNIHDETLLLYALLATTGHSGSDAFIKALIENGLNLNQADLVKDLAIFFSSYNPKPVIRFLISKGLDINLTNNNGENLLTVFIKYIGTDRYRIYHYNIIDFLLLNKANINKEDRAGKTPLLQAILAKVKIEIIEQLINNGASLTPSTSGDSPLIACEKSYGPRLTPLLLDKGADINQEDPYGDAILTLYINRAGSISRIRGLLDRGADVNNFTKTDMSPLMCALKRGDIEIIELLVARGADIYKKNSKGVCAMDLASTPDITRALRWNSIRAAWVGATVRATHLRSHTNATTTDRAPTTTPATAAATDRAPMLPELELAGLGVAGGVVDGEAIKQPTKRCAIL